MLFAMFLGIHFLANAHTINYALQNAPVQEVAWYYFKLGFTHIVPQGLDHVLFIIGICLINTKLKPIIYQATAFTVAHTIALALSMKNIIVAPAPIVEPIIALSIVFVAVENMILQESKAWRLLLVFLFGLIHGLGFASALNETGLPPNRFFTSILLFNLGIEICQLLIIAALYFLVIQPFKNKSWYRYRIVFPVSIAIALVSGFWVIERLTG
ncbi:MAG: HupE/UreJ family protein [Gloeobacteraceae cyanobacterium ES-bin-316]|nr:HupE/UreJ family protein [Ferruginibacter sp.]